MTISINLHLRTAITENTLGHDGDHIDAVIAVRNYAAGDYKRGWLVIRVGGAGTDCGDEFIR